MFLSNIWVFYQCFIKHLGVSGRGIPAHVWRSSGLHASVAASSGMFLRLLKLDGGTDGARDVPVGSAPRHASSCLQLAPFLRGVPTAEPLVFLSGDAGPTGCSSSTVCPVLSGARRRDRTLPTAQLRCRGGEGMGWGQPRVGSEDTPGMRAPGEAVAGTGPGRDGLEHWRHRRARAAGAGRRCGGLRGLGIWSQVHSLPPLSWSSSALLFPFCSFCLESSSPRLALSCPLGSVQLLPPPGGLPCPLPAVLLRVMGWVVGVSVPVLESKL